MGVSRISVFGGRSVKLAVGLLACGICWGQTEYNNQIKFKPGLLSDQPNYTTLYAACSAAVAAGQALALTKTWTGVVTGSCPANIVPYGGRIRPASGQTVTITGPITAGNVQIFDYSAGGTVALPYSYANPVWFGADLKGSLDSAAAIGYALAASLDVPFPLGNFNISTAIPVTRDGQHISCAGNGWTPSAAATTLQWTGATNGFNLVVTGLLHGIEIDHCQLSTSNAAAGKAINAASTTVAAPINIHDISIVNSGSGAWATGIYGDLLEVSGLNQIRCIALTAATCISLHNASNSVTIDQLFVSSSITTGVLIRGSLPVRITNSTFDGEASNAFIDQDGGTVLDGDYFESAAVTPHYIVTVQGNGPLTLSNSLFSGVTSSDALWHKGSEAVNIDNLYASMDVTSGCIIRVDGNAGENAGPATVRGGFIQNLISGQHDICIGVGVGTTGVSAGTISGVQLNTNAGTPIVLAGAFTPFTIHGNSFANTGGYAIDLSSLFGGLLYPTGNRLVAAGMTYCNGCNAANTAPESLNVLGNGDWISLPAVPAVAGLPACGANTEGLHSAVNNSNAASFTAGIGAIVAAGGTTHVPVYCDGVNWRIG